MDKILVDYSVLQELKNYLIKYRILCLDENDREWSSEDDAEKDDWDEELEDKILLLDTIIDNSNIDVGTVSKSLAREIANKFARKVHHSGGPVFNVPFIPDPYIKEAADRIEQVMNTGKFSFME